MHLENKTLDNLLEWKNKIAFASFASITNGKRSIELGVNGNGVLTIRIKEQGVVSVETFENEALAIQRYSELLS